MSIVIDTTTKRSGIAQATKPQQARRRPWLHSSRLADDLYLVFEVLLVLTCGVAAAAYHVGYNLGSDDYLQNYMAPIFTLAAIYASIAKGRGLYEFQALCNVSAAMGHAIVCLFAAFALLIVIGFALGNANDYSRIWLGLWLATSIAALLIARIAASALLVRAARAGLIRRRTAVFGDAVSVGRVREAITRSTPEIELVGAFERRSYPWNDDRDGGQTIADLISFGQQEEIDLVIVARDAFAEDSLHETLSALSVLPAEVRIFLDFGDSGVPIRGMSRLHNLVLLDSQRRPISGWNRLIKVCEDYVVAAIAVVLLAPVLLAVAIAIRIDSPGPVFFRQRRHGFNHSVIQVWKFRTMRVMEDGDEFVQAVRDDDRVTRIGRFLRKTSLDELPQLFNVLAGEMSIVGPRPHPLALNNRYVDLLERYGSRHRVKPGITGWAQINGFRGPTGDPYLMQRRVELDLEYIENWSIWMDLKILALTPFKGLTHPNAL